MLYALLLPLLLLFSSCGGDPYAEANKLLADGKLPEAQAAFAKLAQERPKEPQAWLGLGIAKAKQVDHEGAIAEYNKAIGLLSEAPDSIKGKVYYNRGMSYFAIANFESCSADMQQGLNFKYAEDECYTFLGVCTAYAGDEVKALDLLTKALKVNPDHLWALSNRGYYASKLGDNATAIRDLTRVTQLSPTDAAAMLNLGYTYLQSGDVANAEKSFDAVLKMEPNNFGGIVYKGIVLNHQGRDMEALPFFDRALTIEPENASVHYYRGVSLIALGSKDEGCMELQFAVDHGEALAARMLQDTCN